jgi:hypothetical protein
MQAAQIANREYGAKILGSFVGSDAYMKEQLRNYCVDLKRTADKLIEYPSFQGRFLLFQKCFAPKPVYLMRTMPPALSLEILAPAFEELKKRILCSILTMPVNELLDGVYDSCNFNIAQGGLGLHDAREVVFAGYVSSVVYYSISATGKACGAADLIMQEARRVELEQEFERIVQAVEEATETAQQSEAHAVQLQQRHGVQPSDVMITGLLGHAFDKAIQDRQRVEALTAERERMRNDRGPRSIRMLYTFVQLLADPACDVKPDIIPLRDKVEWMLAQRNKKNRDEGSLQGWLTDALSIKRHAALQEVMDPVRLAWFVELQCQEAGLWLLDKPKFASTRFSNAEYRTALRYRLLLPVYNLRSGALCTCRKGAARPKIDRFGLHLGTGCPLDRHRIDTHDSCVLCIDGMLKWMGHSTVREERGLFREIEGHHDNNMKPDISINNPISTSMRKMLLDFSVTAPIIGGESGVARPESRTKALDRFHLGNKRIEEKKRTYSDLASKIGCGFEPIVYMSTGAPSDSVKQFFDATAKQAKGYLKLDAKIIYTFVMRQISVTLQKGVARAINQRVYALNAGASCAVSAAVTARALM